MSIRQIDKIPKAVRVQRAQPFEYTNRIRDDIKEAYENRISTFELVDYDNPVYVASCARTIAQRYISKIIYVPARQNIVNRVKDHFRGVLGNAVNYIKIQLPYTAEPAIKIYGVTVDGEKHVYAKIDFEYIENFEDIMVEKHIKYYNNENIQSNLVKYAERKQRRNRT